MEIRNFYTTQLYNAHEHEVWQRNPEGEPDLVGHLTYDPLNDCWENHADYILYREPDQAFAGLVEVIDA